MPLTFGSVAMLAAKFDTPVTRIDPSDTKAKLDRVVVGPQSEPVGCSERPA